MSPEGADAASAATEDPCIVPGCGAPSVRRLALAEARRAFSDLPEKGRRAPLCREHYRAWKKATRESRALDRLGH
jgi:hypothetical protein